jgi:hypothetical protein
MQSKATTVAEYLRSLPADRREAITAVRKVILENLDKEYEEGMGSGMIGYSVPHKVFPAGYHCDPSQPLPYAGLASQKQYMALYLMCLYMHSGEDAWFRQAWKKTGKKLDMGKCCVRFKKLDDVPLEVIAEAIRRSPARKYIEFYEQSMAANAARKTKGPPARKASNKAAGKKAAKKTARRAAAKG